MWISHEVSTSRSPRLNKWHMQTVHHAPPYRLISRLHGHIAPARIAVLHYLQLRTRFSADSMILSSGSRTTSAVAVYCRGIQKVSVGDLRHLSSVVKSETNGSKACRKSKHWDSQRHGVKKHHPMDLRGRLNRRWDLVCFRSWIPRLCR